MNVHAWPLRTMLNAAEVALDRAAEDDAERTRNEMKLWEPPAGHASSGRRVPPRGARMGQGEAQALAARLAAEDARFGAV
ncbi:hypothetical protein ACPCSP_25355 [Streptomyces cinereoruber]|uniref:hypothetical protein n=1 Tax=Streptomyces cinereoruber TaxID=67260 RepID=UPI003C2C4110